MAVATARRRADRDENGVGAFDGRRQIGGEGEAVLGDVIGDKFVETRLVNRNFAALQTLALKLQVAVPVLAQVLPILPFPLMIFALLVVYSPSVEDFLVRLPPRTQMVVRRLLTSEPPSALGTHFEQE